MNKVLCADIGGSFIKFGISYAPGRVREVARVPTPVQSLPDLAQAVKKLCADAGAEADVPLGISFAGLVDPRTGIGTSANVPGLSGVPVAEAMASSLGRPVFAANDGDCLSLAEAEDGAGRGHDVVFCVIMGTGIGGGLVAGGRLLRGFGGITGEWGHGPIVNICIEIEGERVTIPRFACGCGQSGCVDTVGGARGIERVHGFLHGETSSSREIIGSWQAGDARSRKTVAAIVELVADPLALAVNITGASIVPVGGGLASAKAFIAELDLAVRRRILARAEAPLLVPAHHREDGGLVGAAILARQGGADVRPA